jgi:hypothetical protein
VVLAIRDGEQSVERGPDEAERVTVDRFVRASLRERSHVGFDASTLSAMDQITRTWIAWLAGGVSKVG